MILRPIIGALTLLIAADARALEVTNCADLQSAVAANNASVEVNTSINCSSTVTISGQNVELRGTGSIVAATNAAVLTLTAARTRISGLTLWNTNTNGPGIAISGGSSVHIEGTQINTMSWGLYATSGAGLYLDRVHFNGLTAGAAGAILLGAWDTATITDVLIEEHDVGLRLGWFGHTANVLISNLIIDRSLIAVRLEPTTGGRIDNVFWSNLWTAGRAGAPSWANPLAIDTSSGPVSTVRGSALYATGFPVLSTTQWGTVGGAGFSIGWQYHQ